MHYLTLLKSELSLRLMAFRNVCRALCLVSVLVEGAQGDLLLEDDFTDLGQWTAYSDGGGAASPEAQNGALLFQINSGEGMRHVRITTVRPQKKIHSLVDEEMRLMVEGVSIRRGHGTAPPAFQVGVCPVAGNLYTGMDSLFFSQVEDKSAALYLRRGGKQTVLHKFDSAKLGLDYKSVHLGISNTGWKMVLFDKNGVLLQEAKGDFDLSDVRAWEKPLFVELQVVQGNNASSHSEVGAIRVETAVRQ